MRCGAALDGRRLASQLSRPWERRPRRDAASSRWEAGAQTCAACRCGRDVQPLWPSVSRRGRRSHRPHWVRLRYGANQLTGLPPGAEVQRSGRGKVATRGPGRSRSWQPGQGGCWCRRPAAAAAASTPWAASFQPGPRLRSGLCVGLSLFPGLRLGLSLLLLARLCLGPGLLLLTGLCRAHQPAPGGSSRWFPAPRQDQGDCRDRGIAGSGNRPRGACTRWDRRACTAANAPDRGRGHRSGPRPGHCRASNRARRCPCNRPHSRYTGAAGSLTPPADPRRCPRRYPKPGPRSRGTPAPPA